MRGTSAARLATVSAAIAGGAFTLASWAGCSSSTSDVATEADAASESAPPGDDAGDLAIDGAPAVDAADAAPADHVGAIFAISDTTAKGGGAKSAYRAGASFTHVTSPDGTTQTRTVGPCIVEIIGDGAAAQETDVSAGPVHVTGGSKKIDLTPNADATYDPSVGATSLYVGGETLTVTGDGKDVPPFTTSLTAPSKITLAAPVVTAGSLTVMRSAGVTATFSGASGGSGGSVVLYFSATSATMAFALTCTFDAAAGGGTIPPAAFADFPAGNGTFDFYVKQTSRVVVAPWDVRFTASKAVVDPAGIALAGDATFE